MRIFYALLAGLAIAVAVKCWAVLALDQLSVSAPYEAIGLVEQRTPDTFNLSTGLAAILGGTTIVALIYFPELIQTGKQND